MGEGGQIYTFTHGGSGEYDETAGSMEGCFVKHTLNIWVIGGDLRQEKLALLLEGDGHVVHTCALGEAPEGEVRRGEDLEGSTWRTA